MDNLEVYLIGIPTICAILIPSILLLLYRRKEINLTRSQIEVDDIEFLKKTNDGGRHDKVIEIIINNHTTDIMVRVLSKHFEIGKKATKNIITDLHNKSL